MLIVVVAVSATTPYPVGYITRTAQSPQIAQSPQMAPVGLPSLVRGLLSVDWEYTAPTPALAYGVLALSTALRIIPYITRV